MITLASVAVHLPPAVVQVADLPELSERTEQEQATALGLGIETVTVDDAASAPDLAVRAARDALANAGVDAADLDAVVYIESRVPQAFMASEAAHVQARLGAERALSFSVGGLGCVSITPALMAAGGLLASNPAMQHVLIAHGSKPPAPRRYRHPVTVNGEAGLGVVVSRDGPLRIVELTLETNGTYWDLFKVEFKDRPVDDWVEECADLPTYSFRLAIESRNRFRSMNESLLARQHLGMHDVDRFVMQNLSEGAFRFYEEAFAIRFAEACRTNVRRCGHLGPIDVLFNLSTAIESGEAREGERVLVMNASPSAAWSSMVVEIGAPRVPGAFEL